MNLQGLLGGLRFMGNHKSPVPTSHDTLPTIPQIAIGGLHRPFFQGGQDEILCTLIRFRYVNIVPFSGHLICRLL